VVRQGGKVSIRKSPVMLTRMLMVSYPLTGKIVLLATMDHLLAYWFSSCSRYVIVEAW